MSQQLDELLNKWEGTYKKGLLSFWILLLLSQRKAYPYEIKDEIAVLSQQTISADENSIYRALKRLSQSGVVESEIHPSETGPNRRYFFLTELGQELLNRFIARNILIFQKPEISELIQTTLRKIKE
ncbi:MAG: helix-turn-helix transcriptional regulator [Anaerolineaceae bacterium]|nr:helix-turn-helix transcriptional regulator [Anaerolineaceae bacterium]